MASRKEERKEGDWSVWMRLVRRARGNRAEAVHARDQGCQGKGGKELNQGLGATSEEMVGGRRIGEDQGLESSERARGRGRR